MSVSMKLQVAISNILLAQLQTSQTTTLYELPDARNVDFFILLSTAKSEGIIYPLFWQTFPPEFSKKCTQT
jgi:hypothetical protein